ncbi:MAG: D-tyrosyl-tRNA(Tyr) deacylase [Deltaproteobacteria bacterium]|jgi:D-tyrosyl-tRNA(Tyr) deacylase|nr:D-tyrosyl-tRNA(Tyr) deacylase [Deltaproteobacteria bacterium]MBW2503602.1 D-tyrosyl-tRNA(Tyr) deacylase [Deltaproteobacteria bacterium]
MRAVIQRVTQAQVFVDNKAVGQIEQGLVVLLGIAQGDGDQDIAYLADKVAGLRVFEDNAGKMNLSVSDIAGGVLVVSQFTLLGDCRKGRRPSFTGAEQPQRANTLYESFVSSVRQKGIRVATGIFQAAMQIKLVNDGPVTLILDSRKQF